jgi:beta-lactamase class A
MRVNKFTIRKKWPQPKFVTALLISLVLLSIGSMMAMRALTSTPRSLINPLLRYVEFKELQPFRYKVVELIRKEKEAGWASEVAVYFRSLSDGLWFGIDEKVKFAPASLLKVPCMIAYFKLAETKPGILEENLTYNEYLDDSDIYIKPASRLVVGNSYSLDTLIKQMIRESDNNAFLTLWKSSDKDFLVKTFVELGVIPRNLSSMEVQVSLKSFVSIFRILYNVSYLNNKFSQKALEYLTATDFKYGIVAGVPADITVAHKFGERYLVAEDIRQLHDVGIVYHPHNPYLLGVMTKGKDFPSLSKVIKEVSELIYNEVDSQYKSKKIDNFQISEE